MKHPAKKMAIEDVVPWYYVSKKTYYPNNTIIFKGCTLKDNIGEYESGDEFYKISLDFKARTFVFHSKTREFKFNHEERIVIL